MKKNFVSYNFNSETVVVFVWKYTETCNMKCSYCNIDNSGKINKKNFNKILANKILKESILNPNINFLIDIEGGEPTLDKTVFDLPNLLNQSNIYLKLFTNFFKPDFNKLCDFAQYHKIELSCNIDENNINVYVNDLITLSNTLINKNNIEVSILVTKISDITQLQKIMNTCIRLNIKYFISAAENFSTIGNEIIIDKKLQTILDEHIISSRLKFNFYNWFCNCRMIHITCSSIGYGSCAMIENKNILALDINKIMHNKSICKNNICGIHDYQLDFKKEYYEN